jgi:hypothetical protein
MITTRTLQEPILNDHAAFLVSRFSTVGHARTSRGKPATILARRYGEASDSAPIPPLLRRASRGAIVPRLRNDGGRPSRWRVTTERHGAVFLPRLGRSLAQRAPVQLLNAKKKAASMAAFPDSTNSRFNSRLLVECRSASPFCSGPAAASPGRYSAAAGFALA